VLFKLPDGETKSIGEGELKAGDYSATYHVRAHPDEAGSEFTRTGLPVKAALEQVVGDYGYLTISRPNGTTSYLPAEWFQDPSSFEGGTLAVFSFEEGSTHFVRPLLEERPDDVNAEDNIATVSGEALSVGVHQGHVVEVQVTASTTSTTAGSPVQFTATVPGGSDFTFSWTFGDGTTATGESVSHAFSGSGTFQVRATAVGEDESGGESGPVSVVVGNPPTTEQPGATTTRQPKAKKPKGSPGKGREGRGGNGSKSSSSGGKNKGSNDSSAQRGDSPAGWPHSPGSSKSAAPSPSPVPLPEATAPMPVPAPVEPSGGDSAEPPRCCSAESPPDGSPRPSPSSGSPEGELVEGRLVGDDLGATSIEEAAGGSAAEQGLSSAAGAVGSGGAGVPVVALIVVALLSGGALFEWRRSRPVR
jgi:hypothetical protein